MAILALWRRYQDALRLANLCGSVALAVDEYDRARERDLPPADVDRIWGRMERLMGARGRASGEYARRWMRPT